jgi:hypothetical protein
MSSSQHPDVSALARTIHVAPLHAKLSDSVLRTIFAKECGAVSRVALIDGRQSGLVEFKSKQGADAAIRLKGTRLTEANFAFTVHPEATTNTIDKGRSDSARTVYIPCFPAGIDIVAFFERCCGPVQRCSTRVTACAYGFVEFECLPSVEAALTVMVGRLFPELGSEALKIRPAKTSIQQFPRGVPFPPDGRRPPRPASTAALFRTIHVAPLRPNLPEEDLCGAFQALCGPVVRVFLVDGRQSGLVEFSRPEGVMEALKLKGLQFTDGHLTFTLHPEPTTNTISRIGGFKDSNQSTRTIYIPCFPANMDLSAFFEKHCGAVARTKVAVTACAYGFVEFHAADAVEKALELVGHVVEELGPEPLKVTRAKTSIEDKVARPLPGGAKAPDPDAPQPACAGVDPTARPSQQRPSSHKEPNPSSSASSTSSAGISSSSGTKKAPPKEPPKGAPAAAPAASGSVAPASDPSASSEWQTKLTRVQRRKLKQDAEDAAACNGHADATGTTSPPPAAAPPPPFAKRPPSASLPSRQIPSTSPPAAVPLTRATGRSPTTSSCTTTGAPPSKVQLSSSPSGAAPSSSDGGLADALPSSTWIYNLFQIVGPTPTAPQPPPSAPASAPAVPPPNPSPANPRPRPAYKDRGPFPSPVPLTQPGGIPIPPEQLRGHTYFEGMGADQTCGASPLPQEPLPAFLGSSFFQVTAPAVAAYPTDPLGGSGYVLPDYPPNAAMFDGWMPLGPDMLPSPMQPPGPAGFVGYPVNGNVGRLEEDMWVTMPSMVYSQY